MAGLVNKSLPFSGDGTFFVARTFQLPLDMKSLNEVYVTSTKVTDKVVTANLSVTWPALAGSIDHTVQQGEVIADFNVTIAPNVEDTVSYEAFEVEDTVLAAGQATVAVGSYDLI